jgi:hypothetical protein
MSLLGMARSQSIDKVLDLMIATASENQTAHSVEEAEGLSLLGLRAVKFSRRFQTQEDELEWLSNVSTDAELISKIEEELNDEVGGAGKHSTRIKASLEQMLKAGNWMKDQYLHARQAARADLARKRNTIASGLERLRKRARMRVKAVGELRRSATTHITAATFTHPIRHLFHGRLFFFIGDSFLYFGQRGTPQAPGPIVQRILAGIDRAVEGADSKNDSELIVVAHSMGGNIMCDIVSHFRPEQKIDLLITVASQFPLFADLHMFPGLDTHTRPIAKPPNVRRWINVYDMNDVFGFTAQPMFTGVEDVEYASGKFGTTTHADCFKFVSLYEHLAQAVLKGEVAV